MKVWFLPLVFLLIGAIGGYAFASSTPFKGVGLPGSFPPNSQVGSKNTVVKGITANVDGTMVEVKGDRITLGSENDKLIFTVPNETSIMRIKLPPPINPLEGTASGQPATPPNVQPEKIGLGDIKVGERVSGILSQSDKGYEAINLTVVEIK